MALPEYRFNAHQPESSEPLKINAPLVAEWLVKFLRDECIRRRGMPQAVLGLSGGVDSAVVAYLCAKAFGPENVLAVRMPYKTSSPESLSHAQLVIDDLNLRHRTIELTDMVQGYVAQEAEITPYRIGNVCARLRMTILFDLALKQGALPIGTGNKTERLFGYFTWHADDAPPINPLGDLLKTQVFQLAREVGVPDVIVNKPPSADLIQGQTDEGDFGITFERADRILHYLVQGYSKEKLLDMGFAAHDVETVWNRVSKTHWKRHLPTVAMLSTSAIGEYYLRPVDY
jgi:NAD+ synthetase